MLACMGHDPSYVSGEVFVPELGVWSGWIAHPDSFASRVSSYRHPDGSVLLFSGECFPSSEGISLAHIADAGRFVDSVVDGCRCEGLNFLRRLNGMFSGLLIDRTSGKCIVFNDRFGCERIHVHEAGEEALFASEAKALLRLRRELRAFDPQAVAEYLAYGSVGGGKTLFRGIDLLPGASVWQIGTGGIERKRRYFDPDDWISQPRLTGLEFDEALGDLLTRAMPAYLVGDKEVGISITAGLDTRMIMACLPSRPLPAVCYTYAGTEGQTLDARIGQTVANACGCPHHLLRIGIDFVDDYPSHLEQTVFRTDGCAGPLEAHEIYLSRAAARLSAVRVTGNYGSEILRGMSTMKRRVIQPGLLTEPFAAQVAAVNRSEEVEHPVQRAAFEEVPLHLFGTLAAARSVLTVRTPYMDNEIVRLAFRAPAFARASPAASLRVIRSRSPTLAAIPTDRGLLPAERHPIRGRIRTASASVEFKLDYWHKEGLPAKLRWIAPVLDYISSVGMLRQHKFLPYRAWFQKELRSYITDVLTDPQTTRSPFWDANGLKRVVEDHVSGRRNCLYEISAVLALETVKRTLLRQLQVERLYI